MIGQLLFFAGLQLGGILAFLPWRRGTSAAFLAITGLLWGVALWGVGVLACVLLGVPSWPVVSAGLLMAAAVAGTILAARRGDGRLAWREWLWIAAAMAIQAGLVALTWHFNCDVASTDSIVQVLLGRNMACHFVDAMGDWGLLLPGLEGGTLLFGGEYLVAAQAVLGASLLALTFHLGWRLGEHLGLGPGRWLTALLPVLGLVTSDFILFQFFYIHNSILTAAYVMAALVALWRAVEEDSEGWLAMLCPALIGLGLARVEGALYCLLVLALLLSYGRWSYRAVLWATLPPLALLLAWHLRILGSINQDTSISSRGTSLAFIAALAAGVMAVILHRAPVVRSLARQGHLILLGVLLLGTVAAFVAKSEHMQVCASMLIANATQNGRWGVIWIGVAALSLLALGQPRLAGERLFAVGVPSLLLLILLMGVGRTPYRMGFGDSGNRLLTLALAPALCYLTGKFAAGLWRPSPQERPARNSLGVALALVLLLGAAGVLLWRGRLVNVAVGAEVVEQPRWSRGHEFSIALRGTSDAQYVASLGTAPVSVIIKLPSRSRARLLEVTEYHPTLAMDDYAWEISRDGINWRGVYDTRTSPPGVRRVLSPVVTRFTLDRASIRYVRLTLRHAKGQNRLFLRGLRVLR